LILYDLASVARNPVHRLYQVVRNVVKQTGTSRAATAWCAPSPRNEKSAPKIGGAHAKVGNRRRTRWRSQKPPSRWRWPWCPCHAVLEWLPRW